MPRPGRLQRRGRGFPLQGIAIVAAANAGDAGSARGERSCRRL
jgi:hypothetical protein